MQSLTVIEGMPPLEELQRYSACGAAAEEEGGRGGSRGASAAQDLTTLVASLPAGLSAPKTFFAKGDLVRIIQGGWLGRGRRERGGGTGRLAERRGSRRTSHFMLEVGLPLVAHVAHCCLTLTPLFVGD